jgi:hypothetical protein
LTVCWLVSGLLQDCVSDSSFKTLTKSRGVIIMMGETFKRNGGCIMSREREQGSLNENPDPGFGFVSFETGLEIEADCWSSSHISNSQDGEREPTNQPHKHPLSRLQTDSQNVPTEHSDERWCAYLA